MNKIKVGNNVYIDKGRYYELSVNNSNIIYIVDKESFDWMSRYTWYSEGSDESRQRYLVSGVRNNDGKNTIIRYHVEVMRNEIESLKASNSKNDKRIVVDHIDGDEKNNLKENLRVVTQSENNMNKVVQKNNSTGFVGVTWHTGKRMWESSISINNKSIHLGNYYYLRNALKERLRAEKEYFGEYALYNRDDEYNTKINKILSLPSINEPVLGSSRVPSTGHKYIYKNGNKYFIMINGVVKGRYSLLSKALEDRERAFKDEYGDREFIPHEKRKDKQI